MSFDRITTAGAGTMGSQVAWQMAFHGKQVVVYDAIPDGLERGKALHGEYARHFVEQRGATREQIGATFARLSYTTDLGAAVRDADLISESVPESMAIKESFWREASRLAPARTVFTTNTSTLPPSALAGFVDRPQQRAATPAVHRVLSRGVVKEPSPTVSPFVVRRTVALKRPRVHYAPASMTGGSNGLRICGRLQESI